MFATMRVQPHRVRRRTEVCSIRLPCIGHSAKNPQADDVNVSGTTWGEILSALGLLAFCTPPWGTLRLRPR